MKIKHVLSSHNIPLPAPGEYIGKLVYLGQSTSRRISGLDSDSQHNKQ